MDETGGRRERSGEPTIARTDTVEAASLPAEIAPMRPSSPMVSSSMSRHPRRDTGPERALRRALHAAGYRFRVQYPVPGWQRRTIDIAFTKRRVAVFVDGCFWHACQEHRGVPSANKDWWREKLAKNVARDLDTNEYLRGLGWRVVRVWEHQDIAEAVTRIRHELDQGQ
jgi:DNA mismatch endonuclease (patch repair protein)